MSKSVLTVIWVLVCCGVLCVATATAVQCDIKCDTDVKCVRIRVNVAEIYEYRRPALLEINTDVNHGDHARGSDPNEWRAATGQEVCPAVVEAGGIVTWGKYETCTSNENWIEHNSAEECWNDE
jgi:hypothetical protein